jgi:hypothetical protein
MFAGAYEYLRSFSHGQKLDSHENSKVCLIIPARFYEKMLTRLHFSGIALIIRKTTSIYGKPVFICSQNYENSVLTMRFRGFGVPRDSSVRVLKFFV